MHTAAFARPARCLAFISVAATASFARADYVCEAIPEPPGAAYGSVGGWKLNNAGDVILSADIGSFVYSSSKQTYTPLPEAHEPGKGKPLIPAYNLGALGINNQGTISGSALFADGSTHAFILTNGRYSFFTDHNFGNTEARDLNDLGLVVGTAYDYDDSPFGLHGPAIVNNREELPGYPTELTELVTTLADGSVPVWSLAAGVNNQGVAVGSASFLNGTNFFKWSFVNDPAATPAMRFFQINGYNTAARDINNLGQIAGFAYDPIQDAQAGFVLDRSGSVQFVNCANLGAIQVVLQSINDDGVVSGAFSDPDGNSHAMIAYPN
jgi:uncharacterized membrane protein